ncbi:MAG: division/cell wall cluster transcriptional repressor MraZ, partial [bacterium]
MVVEELFGSFSCTIENGRIKLPAPFCKVLSIDSKQKFHITRENSDSLYLYTQEQWGEKVVELRNLRIRERGEERLRNIADKYHLVEVDKNGRMTIPQDLREAVGLDRRVVVVGL